MQVIGTKSRKYTIFQNLYQSNNNGAYFYAKEIEENILPHINDIDITIVTVGASLFRRSQLPYGAVVVCHDNVKTLRIYNDLLGNGILWICSRYSTMNELLGVGERAIYIPLSIDIEYVKQFKTEKTKETAFVGNAWGYKKKYLDSLSSDIVQLSGMKREELLKEMAKYKRVIAEDRCIMEAQVLGAETETPKYEDGIESIYYDALDNRDTIPYWKLALETYAGIQKRGG